MTKSNKHLISLIDTDNPNLSRYLKENPDITLYFDSFWKYSLLFYSISCGRKTETIKALIDDHRFLGLTDLDGQTHFMVAVKENKLDVAQLLLEQNPSCLHELDKKNQNALHYANQPEMIFYLLNQNIDISVVNKEGKTAIEKMKADKLNDAVHAYEVFLLKHHLSEDLTIQPSVSTPKI